MAARVDQDLPLILEQPISSNARTSQDLIVVLKQQTLSNAHVGQDLLLSLGKTTSSNAHVSQNLILVLVSNTPSLGPIAIAGGPFIDASGNPVSNGTLLMQLTQDGMSVTGQVAEGILLYISLDVNGNIAGSPTVWPTNLLSPAGIKYNVWVQTNSGAQVFGPHQETVLAGGTFNIAQNWTTPLP